MSERASIAAVMPSTAEGVVPSGRHESKCLKRIIVAALLLLAAAGAYGLAGSVDLSEVFKPERLAAVLDSFGPWAPLILILSMATAVVIAPIPSLPLDLAAGAVFGPFWGTFYVVIGAEIGAILSFLIGRALGRDAMSRLLKVDLVFCQKCTDHQLMGMIFCARLLPVFSFDLISYGAGLTNISLKTFALATLVGMIPGTFAFTYFGSSLVSAQWTVLAASVVMVTFFLVTPKLFLRYRSSRLACLILGPVPQPSEPQPGTDIRCAGCGAPLELRSSAGKVGISLKTKRSLCAPCERSYDQ